MVGVSYRHKREEEVPLNKEVWWRGRVFVSACLMRWRSADGDGDGETNVLGWRVKGTNR